MPLRATFSDRSCSSLTNPRSSFALELRAPQMFDNAIHIISLACRVPPSDAGRLDSVQRFRFVRVIQVLWDDTRPSGPADRVCQQIWRGAVHPRWDQKRPIPRSEWTRRHAAVPFPSSLRTVVLHRIASCVSSSALRPMMARLSEGRQSTLGRFRHL